jgi:hypothetical protein
MALNYGLQALSDTLDGILNTEAVELLNKINAKPGTSGSPFISLPHGPNDDATAANIARLVARTSNEYGQACRMAGVARAQYKISIAAYKHKFRISQGPGRNEAEREKPAVIAATEEYNRMILMEAMVELCESIESAMRIASESSRRMLLGVDQQQKADARFSSYSDSLKDQDFSPV